ncbi:hypothetical protein KFJ24_02975 [Marinobacter sediminum]|uniref:hypothetical protein n=1 Tax=Marinobacter sediminum TaxID=256323 RepID=UPI00202F73FC|nr:hypothetical protein [Marinobacter sediminum]MCM0611438.1 hypothetical protein [Marinobacter sediminum]
MSVPTTSRTPQPFVAMILGLTLTGCSLNQTLSLGVDDPCDSLKSIIADYPSGFAQYRGRSNNFKSVTVFSAEEEIIKGHCEIWSWANNDTAYVCSANAPNDEVAAARYNTAVSSTSQCLGTTWQSDESDRVRDGEKAGVATHFKSPDAADPGVSVHRVAFKGNSSVYVYVGKSGQTGDF